MVDALALGASGATHGGSSPLPRTSFMKHHVIYVPGLGDDYWKVQGALIRFWLLYGVVPRLFEVKWADGEPFEPKLQKLLALIDGFAKEGRVSLVGASAGASAILTAFAARKDIVSGVVCICGKVNRPESVSPATYARNRSFKDSMDGLPAALAGLSRTDRQKILSIHPKADNSVPPADTIIPGAVEVSIPTSGHSLSIIAAISIFAGRILGFIKSRR